MPRTPIRDAYSRLYAQATHWPLETASSLERSRALPTSEGTVTSPLSTMRGRGV